MLWHTYAERTSVAFNYSNKPKEEMYYKSNEDVVRGKTHLDVVKLLQRYNFTPIQGHTKNKTHKCLNATSEFKHPIITLQKEC